MRIEQFFKAVGVGATATLLSVMLGAEAKGQQELKPVQQDGFVERLGEQVDRGIDRLSSEAIEGWQSLRRSVDRFGVQARVYSRLRWDKEIATADIDVKVEEEGVVVLRGAMRDEQAKRKAVQLAQDTIDVQKVVDQLSVRPATER